MSTSTLKEKRCAQPLLGLSCEFAIHHRRGSTPASHLQRHVDCCAARFFQSRRAVLPPRTKRGLASDGCELFRAWTGTAHSTVRSICRAGAQSERRPERRGAFVFTRPIVLQHILFPAASLGAGTAISIPTSLRTCYARCSLMRHYTSVGRVQILSL